MSMSFRIRTNYYWLKFQIRLIKHLTTWVLINFRRLVGALWEVWCGGTYWRSFRKLLKKYTKYLEGQIFLKVLNYRPLDFTPFRLQYFHKRQDDKHVIFISIFRVSASAEANPITIESNPYQIEELSTKLFYWLNKIDWLGHNLK